MKTTTASDQNPSNSPTRYATQGAMDYSGPESPKPGDDNYVSQVFHFTPAESKTKAESNTRAESSSSTKRKSPPPKLSYADVASSPPRKNLRSSSTAPLNLNSNTMFPSLFSFSSLMSCSKKQSKQDSAGLAKTNPDSEKNDKKILKSSSLFESIKSQSTLSHSASVSTSSSFKSAKSTSFNSNTSNSSINKKFKSPMLKHIQSQPSTQPYTTNDVVSAKSIHSVHSAPLNAKPTAVTPHASAKKPTKTQTPIDLTSIASTASNVASKSSSIIDVWTTTDNSHSIDTVNRVPYPQKLHSEHSIIDSEIGLVWGPDSKSEYKIV